jgi:hypothetical protein
MDAEHLGRGSDLEERRCWQRQDPDDMGSVGGSWCVWQGTRPPVPSRRYSSRSLSSVKVSTRRRLS